jgi:peptide chain release factor 3
MTADNERVVEEAARRRTFAIISHPDAGKTTLTEKLLLYAGAVAEAGSVTARRGRRAATSDWMELEQRRGISVTSTVLRFEHGGVVFNLLDTPGHKDFSEDTLRVLAAVDSAVILIDAARGVEPQTEQLFRVARARGIPLMAFVNKYDRPGMEPLEMLDHLTEALELPLVPLTWPVGIPGSFHGVIDRRDETFHEFERVTGGSAKAIERVVSARGQGEVATEAAWAVADEELELVDEVGEPFDAEAYGRGELIPLLFGSAAWNFGIGLLLDTLRELAPSPRPRPLDDGTPRPIDDPFAALVFKVQANMDPRHRDRVAFVRICSGRFERGMKVKHVRTDKTMALTAPQFFFAQDRSLAEEAFAGDVVGIPNRGTLRIGDALTEGEDVQFLGIPSFAPEILRRIRLEDAIRAKKLKDALREMAEEGVVQLFNPLDGTQPIVGVIGALQLDVLGDRLTHEYGLPIGFETAPCEVMRWIEADDPAKLTRFIEANRSSIAKDSEGDHVYMAASVFSLQWVEERNPDIKFIDVKAVTQG